MGPLMDIPETRRMLAIVATYDHRQVTEPLVDAWQHALVRQSVEAVFDAIHEHYDRCADAPRVPLNPAEVLHHTSRAGEARAALERKQRDRERNERTFATLGDHRTEAERATALEAMHAGRAELERTLAARRPEQAAS